MGITCIILVYKSTHVANNYVAAKLGIREKLGKMNGLWRDILLMERRSKVIGV